MNAPSPIHDPIQKEISSPEQNATKTTNRRVTRKKAGDTGMIGCQYKKVCLIHLKI